MDDDDDDEWHDSQRSYYGSRGMSWWGPDAGYYPYKSYFWDSVRNRYVVANGYDTWVVDSKDWRSGWSDWDQGWGYEDTSYAPNDIHDPSDAPGGPDHYPDAEMPGTTETPSTETAPSMETASNTPETPDTAETPSTAEIPSRETASTAAEATPKLTRGFTATHDRLALRKPSTLTEPAETPGEHDENGDGQPPSPEQAHHENGDASMGQVPAPGHVEAASTAAPEVPGEAAPSSAGPARPGPIKQERVALPPSEAWRLDKYGNPCSPEALYMRFYRRLRSFLAQ